MKNKENEPENPTPSHPSETTDVEKFLPEQLREQFKSIPKGRPENPNPKPNREPRSPEARKPERKRTPKPKQPRADRNQRKKAPQKPDPKQVDKTENSPVRSMERAEEPDTYAAKMTLQLVPDGENGVSDERPEADNSSSPVSPSSGATDEPPQPDGSTQLERSASIPAEKWHPKTSVECLPESLREIARGAGSDPELIASTMLQAASCVAAKNYVGIGGKGSRKHHTNLYTLTLTPPAGGKSTVLDTIFAPARELERATMKKVEKNRLEIDAQVTRSKIEIKCITKHVQDLVEVAGSDEEINRRTRSIAERKQKSEKLKEESLWLGNLIVNDVTPAGIKQELDIAPDNYNAFVQPDAREFLAVLSKDRKDPKAGAVRQFMLHLFSGDSIIISRGSGKRRRHLPEPRISLTLMAQTDIGLGFIGTAENVQSGLLSRFLIMSFPDATQPPRTLPPHLARRWHSVLEQIYRRSRDQSAQIELRLDHEAQSRLQEIDDRYRKQAEGQTLAISAAMNRAGEQIGRLAVVRALLRLASTGELKSCASPTVILEDVQAAKCFFGLCLGMLKQSLDTVWRERTTDPDVVKLVRLLKSNNGAMRLDALPDHGTKGKKAREIADELPQIFGIRNIQTGKKGRPPQEIFLNENAN